MSDRDTATERRSVRTRPLTTQQTAELEEQQARDEHDNPSGIDAVRKALDEARSALDDADAALDEIEEQ